MSASRYEADRLADDVLAVLEALKLNKPVLVGHSIGGEELSSVGSRHPEKVAGLIYLDAGYRYAYYDRAHGDFSLDLFELEKKLQRLEPGNGPLDQRQTIHLIQEVLETNLPGFERDLHATQKALEAMPAPGVSGPPLPPEVERVARAIVTGEQKYSNRRARSGDLRADRCGISCRQSATQGY